MLDGPDRIGNKLLTLTSNPAFGCRGQVFGDRVVAAAILDRVLHHAFTFNVVDGHHWLTDR